jgi:hypothetical protein
METRRSAKCVKQIVSLKLEAILTRVSDALKIAREVEIMGKFFRRVYSSILFVWILIAREFPVATISIVIVRGMWPWNRGIEAHRE